MGVPRLVKQEYASAGLCRLFTEEGIAIVLGMPVLLLQGLRVNGIGPVPMRIFHGTAWYRKSEVEIYRNNACQRGGPDPTV